MINETHEFILQVFFEVADLLPVPVAKPVAVPGPRADPGWFAPLSATLFFIATLCISIYDTYYAPSATLAEPPPRQKLLPAKVYTKPAATRRAPRPAPHRTTRMLECWSGGNWWHDGWEL